LGDFDVEYKFYMKNKDKLVRKYLNKWVAIKGNKILGCYNNLGDAVELTSLDYEVGSFMVTQVLKKEEEMII